MLFNGDAAKQGRRIGGYRMTDSREHRHIGRAVLKGARFGKVNAFLCGVFPDAARLLFFREQWWKDAAGRNVIFEFEPIADHFVDAEMQRDGSYLEVEGARYKNVAITEVASDFDQRFRLRKNGGLQRNFKQIVGKPDQPVTMHPTISPERKHVE